MAKHLFNYARFVELKQKSKKSFDDNKALGDLTKEIIVQGLYRFGFLDKQRIKILVLEDKAKSEGALYRHLSTLTKHGFIKQQPAPTTVAGSVFVLTRKAFKHYGYLDLDESGYVFSRNKNGADGVSAEHKLGTFAGIISILRDAPNATFLTEREIRQYRDREHYLSKLKRIPDGIVYDHNSVFLVEFEYSEKNRKDRKEALIKSAMDAEYLKRMLPNKDQIICRWNFKTFSMGNVYVKTFTEMSENGVLVDSYGRLRERGIRQGINYFEYHPDPELFEFCQN